MKMKVKVEMKVKVKVKVKVKKWALEETPCRRGISPGEASQHRTRANLRIRNLRIRNLLIRNLRI